MEQDCVFCKIRDGDIPSDVLYRDDSCFVIRDIAPKAPVHLLVIPTEHFTFLSNLDSGFHATLGVMFETAHAMAGREGVDESGYRLIVSQGADAGQMIDHLHLHVLGGRALGGMG